MASNWIIQLEPDNVGLAKKTFEAWLPLLKKYQYRGDLETIFKGVFIIINQFPSANFQNQLIDRLRNIDNPFCTVALTSLLRTENQKNETIGISAHFRKEYDELFKKEMDRILKTMSWPPDELGDWVTLIEASAKIKDERIQQLRKEFFHAFTEEALKKMDRNDAQDLYKTLKSIDQELANQFKEEFPF
jgi:hypothetical protein